MLKIRAEFMPVVNIKGEITEIIFWEDLIQSEKLPPALKINLPVKGCSFLFIMST